MNPQRGPADLVLANANVVTLDPQRPSARSIRIRNGRIAEVSVAADPWKSFDTAMRIDCTGKTVVPGFIDAHCHVFAYGERLLTLDLGPGAVGSIADIQRRIAGKVGSLMPAAWVRGRGYDEFHLAEKRHPTRWDLDAVAPVNPVRLTHRSGHAHVLNSAALALAGITHETGDPVDGMIDRDLASGEPTGLLYGMHDELARIVPALSGEQADHAIGLASESLVSVGITSVHDTSARNDVRRLAAFRRWRKRGLLRSRVQMAIGWSAFEALADNATGLADDDGLATACGVKILVHETTGRLSPSQGELDAMVERIHRNGFQAILHAVEPAAIEAACIAIERALEASPHPDSRHRIEHCSVCPPDLARRIGAAGITVVTHPAFLYFHGERYLRTMPSGELRHLYPLATLKRYGVALAGSADFPVAPPDPLAGIRAAVSRRAKNGERLLPEEAIRPEAALALFTTNAARALRVESHRGSISPGKVADLVVLSDDPTRHVEAAEATVVEKTFIDGRMVFERND
ncbi:MAG: amidohydrolase [Burkholderiaceae bacterium]|nr:amidohydrolase [Burkholderiaceae bacterium]